MNDSGRGNPAPLSRSYHRHLLSLIGGGTLDERADRFGLGRGTVERLDKYEPDAGPGHRITDRTLRIICDKTRQPYPIISADSPEEVEWFETIQFLRRERPELVRKHMAELARARESLEDVMRIEGSLPKVQ